MAFATRKDAFLSALNHLNEHHDAFCDGSFLHFKVWMISALALCTASYDMYCIFLVTRLIGRDRFQDDPFSTGRLVTPGRMPIGYVGISLTITFVGALLSQILVIPLADTFGRKFMFEVCLIVMFIASIFSAFTFYRTEIDASPEHVVGSFCFWRFWLGLGVGGIYPLTATIVTEYAPKYSRGMYQIFTFASHGLGIVFACCICLIASAGVNYNYPGTEFPTAITGCANWLALDGNGYDPLNPNTQCPYDNQSAYYWAMRNSAPSKIEYIWRSVISAGAFGALLTFILSRYLLVETPRFIAQVVGDYTKAIEDIAEQSGIDYRQLAEEVREEGPAREEEFVEVTCTTFIARHGLNLFLCSVSWLIVNLVFSGLLILIDEPTKILGFNKGNIWQQAATESYGLSLGYLTLCLAPLIPGYIIAAVSIDYFGRKVVQFFGFIAMALWCAVCAGTYENLTMPNKSDPVQGTLPGWRGAATGWMFMFALTFFFAAWGPLSTTYAIPAEVFPSKWRATGYSFCAAAGTLGSIIGVWIFLYASQPYPREVTYSYPCDRPNDPSDYLPYGAQGCVKLDLCPAGRINDGHAVGSQCSTCLNGSKSGCYPFGIGVSGSLAVMVPILLAGAVVTMMLPLTDNRSLEEISLDDQEHQDFLRAQDIEMSELEASRQAFGTGQYTNERQDLLAKAEMEQAKAEMMAKARARAAAQPAVSPDIISASEARSAVQRGARSSDMDDIPPSMDDGSSSNDTPRKLTAAATAPIAPPISSFNPMKATKDNYIPPEKAEPAVVKPTEPKQDTTQPKVPELDLAKDNKPTPVNYPSDVRAYTLPPPPPSEPALNVTTGPVSLSSLLPPRTATPSASAPSASPAHGGTAASASNEPNIPITFAPLVPPARTPVSLLGATSSSNKDNNSDDDLII